VLEWSVEEVNNQWHPDTRTCHSQTVVVPDGWECNHTFGITLVVRLRAEVVFPPVVSVGEGYDMSIRLDAWQCLPFVILCVIIHEVFQLIIFFLMLAYGSTTYYTACCKSLESLLVLSLFKAFTLVHCWYLNIYKKYSLVWVCRVTSCLEKLEISGN